MEAGRGAASIPAARLENVSKIYETAAAKIVALKNLSWEVATGEAVALMGPSGCGKTTILNLLGGMDRPSERRDLGRRRERRRHERAAARAISPAQGRLRVPVLQSDPEPVGDGEPRAADADRRHRRGASAQPRRDAAGDRRPASEKGFKRPEELSGGEQQRVAVCIALVNDPPIILADEPTGNLDSANSQDHLRICWSTSPSSEGKTVIVASHDPKVVETFPRVYHMRDGVIRSRSVSRQARIGGVVQLDFGRAVQGARPPAVRCIFGLVTGLVVFLLAAVTVTSRYAMQRYVADQVERVPWDLSIYQTAEVPLAGQACIDQSQGAGRRARRAARISCAPSRLIRLRPTIDGQPLRSPWISVLTADRAVAHSARHSPDRRRRGAGAGRLQDADGRRLSAAAEPQEIRAGRRQGRGASRIAGHVRDDQDTRSQQRREVITHDADRAR